MSSVMKLNYDYEIVYKEGDEVCFKTYFPEFKYQPSGGGGFFGLQLSGGLDKAEKIKGKIILIHDSDYHVLVGEHVYICRHSILKPLAKQGGIIFFEVKKKESIYDRISTKEQKLNPVRQFIENFRSSESYPIYVYGFYGVVAYLLVVCFIFKVVL